MVLVIEMIFGFRHTGVIGDATASVRHYGCDDGALVRRCCKATPIFCWPTATDPCSGSESALTPSEHVLKQKLDAAMAGGLYREAGLSIGVLAERLGSPEHRLRALINRRLGYRNFSAFLNHHRIAEAKAMLAAPAHVDLPILTIAMDLGYGSLAPFNRAFREDCGQTPTDFRRASILQN